jgi:hypothetical protein
MYIPRCILFGANAFISYYKPRKLSHSAQQHRYVYIKNLTP